jgi:hypothetical protein
MLGLPVPELELRQGQAPERTLDPGASPRGTEAGEQLRLPFARRHRFAQSPAAREVRGDESADWTRGWLPERLEKVMQRQLRGCNQSPYRGGQVFGTQKRGTT